ncbi:MAG: hypothetical protein DRQ39_03730 [Gammaproteobacteria bacterium]|nr:MAG: hypothetical protein DRQ39_03730 [Gammaproteobacteria bacterium]
MKLLFIAFALALMSGCAAMSDRGDVSETSVQMPDGDRYTFVRIQRIRFFTPSTEEKLTFKKTSLGEKPERVSNLEQNYQNGMGPSLISGAIQAGATVGAGALIGNGLSDSGDDTSINNGSSSGSVSGAFSGSRSTAVSGSISKARIKGGGGGHKR